MTIMKVVLFSEKNAKFKCDSKFFSIVYLYVDETHHARLNYTNSIIFICHFDLLQVKT